MTALEEYRRHRVTPPPSGSMGDTWFTVETSTADAAIAELEVKIECLETVVNLLDTKCSNLYAALRLASVREDGKDPIDDWIRELRLRASAVLEDDNQDGAQL